MTEMQPARRFEKRIGPVSIGWEFWPRPDGWTWNARIIIQYRRRTLSDIQGDNL